MRTRPFFLLPIFLVLLACHSAAPPANGPATASPPSSTPPNALATAAAAPVATPMLTSPPAPLANDAVVFKLHKFLADVGGERDTYLPLPGGGTEAKAVFSYRDRMSPVALAASYEFDANGALRRYSAWGTTSRFTELDDRVEAAGSGGFDVTRGGGKPVHVAPDGLAAVTSGYAPMLGQELMLRAWDEHGRPPKMALLPEGEVSIESRGKEEYDAGKGKVVLEHLAVSGLVWGREDAWLNDKGQLAAVVTRDAEFDHHEAIREGYEALLPMLAKSTGVDGVAWLAKAAKAAGAERTTTGPFALVGATLIDGTGSPPVKDAVVVIDGDRIAEAGPRTKVAIPPGAITIELTGKAILPGLWDMHAHLEQVEQGVVYLAAGVTTVRDMGNILDFITGIRDAVDSGQGLGPRVLVDGLVDGNGDSALGTIRVNTEAEIAPTIDRLKKAGCIEVKIYSSVSPSLVKPIIAYAHAHGMRAVGHVPTGMLSAQAIEAGYDSISHLPYLFDAVLPRSLSRTLSPTERYKRVAAIDLASPEMTREIAAVVSHHVVIDDTLSLYEQMFHTMDDNAKREPGIATLPRELRATLGGVPASVATEGNAAFAKYVELLRELHKRGVAIVAGTDINVPGHSLHRELELYVQAGFTPMEAIQAATIGPARMMHREKDLGTVEKGKRADLVVVDGDPLADVSSVRKTDLVVARGHVYDSASLWKLVGFHPR